MSQSKNTNHHLLFISSALAFLLLSFLIAVEPAYVMDKSTETPDKDLEMTAEQARGFKIYVRENCAVCHTQQVRPLKMDSEFGRVSVASDFAGIKPINTWIMTPNVLGTARIGPDLSNVGEHRENEMWNYIHLYNPRAVVKESIMPSFNWLFKAVDKVEPSDLIVTVPAEFKPSGKAIVPTREGRELIAYLAYLKQKPLEKDQEQDKTASGFPGAKIISGIYNTKSSSTHQHGSAGFASHNFSTFDYVIISISILIVILAFIFLVKTLFWPNEQHKEHIKHKVLEHK